MDDVGIPKNYGLEKHKSPSLARTLQINCKIGEQSHFQDSSAQLSERIRNVLNNCWENMDAEGGIADPDGRTGKLNY